MFVALLAGAIVRLEFCGVLDCAPLVGAIVRALLCGAMFLAVLGA